MDCGEQGTKQQRNNHNGDQKIANKTHVHTNINKNKENQSKVNPKIVRQNWTIEQNKHQTL